ncbi:MAG: Aspartyl-tRNA(Asn) amidotransferase subunit B @ Glutamyl-tRNA(Gln) amidotransferase subunit B [uncultured Thermoleophilia bacterium]|uniref:Aspartyl/glutamyl-tRNA(Asn/Gln) amidotransferase subunit B n=1 Tax=uncultured Thermoleophilia bacterium TaxID=1497501 RepID=A0A6J4UBW7_9ACTN|nr:MAG: Aspartyl-tRNA(Asn) amidotransferase subunit B @ Glutamyl-tRNA(Gln) amidotransferase subunit B [uncultured Thermoleophilia bacterium]
MSRDGWEAVIGLEIHVQLQTRTKMFCRCANRYGDPPNTNVCQVCLAHPGVLPVPNRAAVHQAIRVGMALGCTIPSWSQFHRKNYFYPDNPKAYQISQYDSPLCGEGVFHVPAPGGAFEVRLERAHIEEDAAKMIHAGGAGGRLTGSASSVVDFNRAGTPLLEIVTRPDLHSGEDARRFLNLLRATIVAIGASDADMEKGSLRCDANVSVRRVGDTALGTKTELKNMNSFRYLERGINAEIERQIGVLEAGDRVRQATMHYDVATGTVHVLRSKEEANDYRYFPEPDLVPLEPDAALLDELRAALAELPAARIERFVGQYGLPEPIAEALGTGSELARWFEELARLVGDGRLAANWTLGDFSAHLNAAGVVPAESPVTPARMAGLVRLVESGAVGTAAAKQVFAGLVDDPDASAEAIVEARGLGQIGDEAALAAVVDEVVAGNPAQVAQFRAGKVQLLGFFTGQVMRQTGGRAEPKTVQRLLRERLDGS